MIDPLRLAEVMTETSVSVVEGAENVRRATDTAYWDFEAYGSILMDYVSMS